VLIVYDFEDDPTVPVARRLAGRWPHLRPVLNDLGRGVLNAIKVGFREARAEAELVTMADGSDDPRAIMPMYVKLLEGYDIVCASRYIPGGSQVGGPFVKSLLSRLAGLSLHWLTGIPTHDITNNFRLYRRHLLKSITIESTGGFEVAMEITVKAYCNGYKIAEVPATWRDRREGESKFELRKWLPKYCFWYGVALRNAWLKRPKTNA
jgi:glycosyltransferase involved in cell wall biosynthesis